MVDVRWNIFEFTHRIPQADQEGNFWRTVKDKHRKPKLIKTELWEENKTDPIQQNKKKKNPAIYSFPNIYTTYLQLYIVINS